MTNENKSTTTMGYPYKEKTDLILIDPSGVPLSTSPKNKSFSLSKNHKIILVIVLLCAFSFGLGDYFHPEWAVAVVDFITPIIMILLGIATGVGAIITVYNTWEKITKWWSNLF